MAIPPDFLEELKARVPCPDVVGRKVKLTRSGRDLKGLCPFHKEKTPSFHCFDDHYHCFGCGEHGGVIDFVMKTDNLGFRETIEKLAGEAGLAIPEERRGDRERRERRATLFGVMDKAGVFFETCLRMPEGREALDYLKNRGLTDATIKRFRLGFAPDGRGALKARLARDGIEESQMIEAGLLIQPDDPARNPYDRFRGRVMFPITDRRNRVIAFGARLMKGDGPKYLNSPETPLFHKGRNLYALAQARDGMRDTNSAIVAEGYMDVIALHQAGFTSAVAPLGTAVTEEQLGLLWKTVDQPVMCLDGDAAGQRAAVRAAERALPILRAGNGLRFALMPAGEDPDSLIQAQGPQAFKAVLEKAKPLSELIWLTESGGAPPANPEARAALDKRLKEKLRAIQDNTVRTFFAESFRERLWPDGGRAPEGRGGGGWKPGGEPWRGRYREPDYLRRLHAGDEDARGLQGDPARAAVLLKLLLLHPALLDEVEDELGMLRFEDAPLDTLRQKIILLRSSAKPLDSEKLLDHLNRHGFSPVLNRIDNSTADIRFARPGAGLAEARRGWTETFDRIRNKELERELREAQAAFGRDPSDENSRWLLRVQAQVLERKSADIAFE